MISFLIEGRNPSWMIVPVQQAGQEKLFELGLPIEVGIRAWKVLLGC